MSSIPVEILVLNRSLATVTYAMKAGIYDWPRSLLIVTNSAIVHEISGRNLSTVPYQVVGGHVRGLLQRPKAHNRRQPCDCVSSPPQYNVLRTRRIRFITHQEETRFARIRSHNLSLAVSTAS